ncbi:MAG: insulinase family protein [Myxococcaceae bacterium]|nr:insulinase family protein [Myxococcaceae bacterium]
MIGLAVTALLALSPDEVKEIKLKNGMVWLVVERPQAPVFTGFVRVRVGGLDEEVGQTGLAHLFEHMAFKGTPMLGTKDFEKEKPLLEQIATVGDQIAVLERAGKPSTAERAKLAELSAKAKALTDENALAKLYQLNGGVGLNATTDKDVTSYFVSLPKNRLELWLTVEAQRLCSPVLRDFYTERDVVQEERRMSIESSPGGALYEELNQVAFTTSPYRWPVVGYTDDLQAMSMRAADAFHRKYYVPSNAVGALVGDVKAAEVQKLLEKTFGQIPAGQSPPAPVFAESPKRAARRSTVTFDASPRVFVAFHKPNAPHPDDYVFDLIEVVLSEGRTGRLHKRLVLKDRLAQSAGAFGAPGSRLPNLFAIAVTPMAGVSNEKIEAAIWEELEKLKTEAVTEQELEKAKNRLTLNVARSTESNSGLASTLSLYQTLFGDWRYVLDHSKVVAALTADDVKKVAATYFRREGSVTVDLRRDAPAPAPTEKTAPEKPADKPKSKGAP